MHMGQSQLVKYNEVYYFAAIACYDTQTDRVLTDLESDFMSGSLTEASDYLMEIAKAKWPEPRYTGHALTVRQFYNSATEGG